MPYDIEINSTTPNVKLLYSTTVELFSCIQLLAIPSHHEDLIDFAIDIRKHLTKDSIDILDEISYFQYHGLELFDFILDIYVLDDISLFVDKLIEYSDDLFVSVLTMDRLNEDQIQKIIHRKLSDEEIEKLLPWAFKESIAEIAPILFNPHEFKLRLVSLILDIYNSPYFLPQVEANHHKYLESLKILKKELKTKTPLELGQQIMNKTFKNVFDYKQYIFCPSNIISPHRLRIHNQNTNFVVYDINRDYIFVNNSLEKVTHTLKILSDKTRLEILRQLSIRSTYGKVLANSLDLTTATISHHLDLLKSIGLVKEDKIKNIKYFYVNKEEVEKVLTLTENYIQNKL